MRCKIIGVLDSGVNSLSPEQLANINEAKLVIASSRVLSLLASSFNPDSKQRDLTESLSRVPSWIGGSLQRSEPVVVLATGDPLCHGIGSYLISKLGLEQCEISPNISTLQLACARFGRAWQAAKIHSIHSSNSGEWAVGSDPKHGLYSLLQKMGQEEFIVLFTSPENSPDRIARMAEMEGLDGVEPQWTMAVAENLEQADEKLHGPFPISDAKTMQFADLNITLLWRERGSSEKNRSRAIFGLSDAEYAQRKPERGLITKQEVRAVSLAKMGLHKKSIVWDVGAGSGSVGIEASRIATEGHIYAIEKNQADAENIEINRQRFQITNYTLIVGKAPAGMEQWQTPDAIFIGGTGGNLVELIKLSLQKMNTGATLVMNFVTIENLSAALEILKSEGAEWNVTQLQSSRSKPILNMHRMEAENPVWIVSAQI